jgi:hypothetical protein
MLAINADTPVARNHAKTSQALFQYLSFHGSINYRLVGIEIAGAEYLARNINAPIKVVQELEALGGGENILPDIVLPGEATRIRHYRSVWPGFEMFKHLGAEFDYLIVTGLSYWDCDRREIDELLQCVSRDAKIIIVHPNPSKVNRELVEKCRSIAKCQICRKPPMLLL